MAQARRQNFKWKSPQGLYRHLSTLEKRLREDFQAEFKNELDPRRRKEIVKIRFRTSMMA